MQRDQTYPEDEAWFQRRESRLHAFVALARDAFEPLPVTGAEATGPLAGLRVGVKDVIDVQGLPTRNGSEACAGARVAIADAHVVAGLRDAGARIVGKTTTTEFAFTDPTDCRNPFDLDRSPGGSSSGSAAAVGAGLVDFALGTQTAGSLCRPAAYCGAVAFKPTYGLWPTTGMTPLARSFDTVGVISRSVGIARRVFRALGGEDRDEAPTLSKIKGASGFFGDLALPDADSAMALAEARYALNAICSVEVSEAELPEVAEIVADHRVVMNHEAFLAHGHLMHADQEVMLKPKFLAGLQAGASISSDQADAARARLVHARNGFWDGVSGTDVILTLPVPEGAPLLDGTTGFQDWLTPWTVFGGPLVCLPWGLDGLGRPRSVMLAARPAQDAMLLGVAQALEAMAPTLAPPEFPEG